MTHSDGHVPPDKKSVRLRVAKKSLLMLFRWADIAERITFVKHAIKVEHAFDARYAAIWTRFVVRLGKDEVGAMRKAFAEFGVDPTSAVLRADKVASEKVLGAYLAGIIDGDGCVQKRRRTDGTGIETLIKIVFSNVEQAIEIQKMLAKFGKPKGYITAYPKHFDLWIYVSKPLAAWAKNVVCPQLAIETKKEKLLCASLPR